MLFCSSRCSRSREVQPTAAASAASAASAAKERDGGRGVQCARIHDGRNGRASVSGAASQRSARRRPGCCLSRGRRIQTSGRRRADAVRVRTDPHRGPPREDRRTLGHRAAVGRGALRDRRCRGTHVRRGDGVCRDHLPNTFGRSTPVGGSSASATSHKTPSVNPARAALGQPNPLSFARRRVGESSDFSEGARLAMRGWRVAVRGVRLLFGGRIAEWERSQP